MAKSPYIEKSADISPCNHYRYSLWRKWRAPKARKGYAMFIGLNPSTADALVDDATIRRCVGFAKEWGFDTLCMTNLFAYRARHPKAMKGQADPVGPKNDATLEDLAQGAGIVIAAWGVHGTHQGRAEAVMQKIPNLHYLQLTKLGHPGHPLFLPRELKPAPFKRTTSL